MPFVVRKRWDTEEAILASSCVEKPPAMSAFGLLQAKLQDVFMKGDANHSCVVSCLSARTADIVYLEADSRPGVLRKVFRLERIGASFYIG